MSGKNNQEYECSDTGMTMWLDPYDEAHTVDWIDCKWCIVEPTYCDECDTLKHNWFIDISPAGRTTMGERCKCGTTTSDRGDRH